MHLSNHQTTVQVSAMIPTSQASALDEQIDSLERQIAKLESRVQKNREKLIGETEKNLKRLQLQDRKASDTLKESERHQRKIHRAHDKNPSPGLLRQANAADKRHEISTEKLDLTRLNVERARLLVEEVTAQQRAAASHRQAISRLDKRASRQPKAAAINTRTGTKSTPSVTKTIKGSSSIPSANTQATVKPAAKPRAAIIAEKSVTSTAGNTATSAVQRRSGLRGISPEPLN